MNYQKFRNLIEERGVSVRRISIDTGIASQDLYQALNGKKPFYPGWKKRVAEALDVDVDELFSDDGGDDIVPVPETDIYELYKWIDGEYVLVSESCDSQMAKKKWDYLFDEHYLAIKEITDSGKEWTVEIKAVDEEET